MFFRTALNGRVELALECGQDDKTTPLGVPNLATDLQTQNEGERRLGGIQKGSSLVMRTTWRKLNLPTITGKCRNTLKDDGLATFLF